MQGADLCLTVMQKKELQHTSKKKAMTFCGPEKNKNTKIIIIFLKPPNTKYTTLVWLHLSKTVWNHEACFALQTAVLVQYNIHGTMNNVWYLLFRYRLMICPRGTHDDMSIWRWQRWCKHVRGASWVVPLRHELPQCNEQMSARVSGGEVTGGEAPASDVLVWGKGSKWTEDASACTWLSSTASLHVLEIATTTTSTTTKRCWQASW